MTRTAAEDNDGVPVHFSPTQRARIAQAAAIQRMDPEKFVVGAALREADAVITQVATVRVPERDFKCVLELLENPPAPNTRLKAAISALPDVL